MLGIYLVLIVLFCIIAFWVSSVLTFSFMALFLRSVWVVFVKNTSITVDGYWNLKETARSDCSTFFVLSKNSPLQLKLCILARIFCSHSWLVMCLVFASLFWIIVYSTIVYLPSYMIVCLPVALVSSYFLFFCSVFSKRLPRFALVDTNSSGALFLLVNYFIYNPVYSNMFFGPSFID